MELKIYAQATTILKKRANVCFSEKVIYLYELIYVNVNVPLT